MIIRHNLSAMNVQRQLNLTGKQNAKSTEKLSSGYKINRAADDAAGLAISEKMRRQIRGLNQGIANTQDGVSLNQVADGALAEVHEMLHRITELSVKAANGTNSPQDRQAIQAEISEILSEIDRIGDTNKFNELPVFKGIDIPILEEDGSTIMPGKVQVKDLQLVDLDLGKYPFDGNSGANHLQLQAIVNKPDSKLDGQSYNMIYENGTTSNSSMRISYTLPGSTVPVVEIVPLESCTIGNYTANIKGNPPGWARELVYKNAAGIEIKVTQKVTADLKGDDEKYYGISYEVENIGKVDVKLDFQFHADTAYNNNDTCEGYFIDGKRIEKSCIYSGAKLALYFGTAGKQQYYYKDTGEPFRRRCGQCIGIFRKDSAFREKTGQFFYRIFRFHI